MRAAALRTDNVWEFTGLRGELLRDQPLREFTSWRTGGPADWIFTPEDRDDLAAFLRQLPADAPVLWIGLGSNLLVRDAGIRGAVIRTHKGLSRLRRSGPARIAAEAGVPCAKAARFSALAGLGGAEFLAGIPGTIGGALAMNAGAFGGETWRIVARVETIDRRGRLRYRDHGSVSVGYRSVVLPGEEWFVGAELELRPGAGPAALRSIRELLRTRGETQPVQSANAGSVFRNPPGDHAARLIETAGLKGLRQGGAVVSQKHANFIINTGDATSADIETLMQRVRKAVLEQFGIDLEPEVRIVGDVR